MYKYYTPQQEGVTRTMSAGALQMVGNHFTPAHWVDVWGTTVDPLVIMCFPTIKVDSEKTADYPRYRADANQPARYKMCLFDPQQTYYGPELGK